MTSKHLFFILYLFIQSIFLQLNAQQINFYKSAFVENKCIDFNAGSNISKSKNLRILKNLIQSKSENSYLISHPISVYSIDNSAFTAFSYVLYGKHISSSDIDFYYSTSNDTNTFLYWNRLNAETENDSTIFSNLTFLDKSSQFVQYKIVFKNLIANSSLKNIRISFINPLLLNAKTDDYKKEVENFRKTSQPDIIKRTEWGCSDGENAPLWTPQYTNVTHIVIHHTAGSNNISQDYPATVRSIWSQHTYTNGWGDIGYNYLIDNYGKIYEGRAGGNNAIGAHCGFNSGTMGVSIMGTYTSLLPSTVALNSLVQLSAWKCTDSQINPLEIKIHTSSGKNINTICGHRDIKSTDCPGNLFYADLADIRNNINDIYQSNNNLQNDIRCYPNPFTDEIKIDIKKIYWSIFTVEVTDIYGRIVSKQKFYDFYNGIIKINLSSSQKGIYFLKILTPDEMLFQEKIVKL